MRFNSTKVEPANSRQFSFSTFTRVRVKAALSDLEPNCLALFVPLRLVLARRSRAAGVHRAALGSSRGGSGRWAIAPWDAYRAMHGLGVNISANTLPH
jgi:hypothetical protein